MLRYRYKTIIDKHSVSIKLLKHINKKYNFNETYYKNYNEFFDNECNYSKLKPIDLLIYNLVKNQNVISKNISKVIDNINKYDLYSYEVKNAKQFGKFDININVLFKKLFLMLEEKTFQKLVKNPTRIY